MTSSGMKRGLAVSAISALAVTGLPLSAAHADSMADQAGTDSVVLYTASNAAPKVASVRNDGVDTKVHLVANGGANVAQVRFSYTHGADAPVVIGTVSRNNGVFSLEWTPAVNLLGEDVTISAQGLSNAGAEITAALSEQLVNVTANATSVDISNAPGSNVGIFEQKYAGETHTQTLGVVSGTTSELTQSIMLKAQGSAAAATPVNAANGGEYGEAANGVRTFKGVADFDGYTFDGTDPKVDQAVVQAWAGSDDNEAVNVYAQEIKGVTVTAKDSNPPASNAATTATVKVVDQYGKAIAGAQVVQEAPAVTKYTDVNGLATFDVTGDADGNTYTYLVNVDDDADYQSSKDFQKSVTVTTYDDMTAGISAVKSDLGYALDFDEYSTKPVSIKVTDNKGKPRNGQAVQYTWTVDPFQAGADTVTNGTGIVSSGTDGLAVVPAPTLRTPGEYTLTAYIEKDGTPGATAGDIVMAPFTMKMGESAVVFADGDVSQALAGGSKTFDAKLQLEDGTALPGREVTFSYTPGDETPADLSDAANGDSFVSATQPAGTTRINNNSAKDTTDELGMVSVSLTDPSEKDQPKELNGDLNADTSGTPNPGGAGDVEVDFLRSLVPANAEDIHVDATDLFEAAGATPGRPVKLAVEVENADGDWLTDLPVTVSVNKGFLSPNAADKHDLVADPAPAEGGLFGEWKSLGDSKELSTDDTGWTGIVAGIEHDAGFQTSDTVTMTVTVKAGGVSTTLPVDFKSVNPLNPGDLKIALSDDQTVGVLPDAPTTEDVFYDVIATDQFDNPVKGESVDISDSGSPALLNDESGDVTVTSNLKGEDPALTLSSNKATGQSLKGAWDTKSNTWTDGSAATEGFQETLKTQDVTVHGQAGPINWYTIDFAKSSYTIGHTGADVQPVGDAVTVNYRAVDQKGEPIQDLLVRYFRSGPDDLQDGDGNSYGITDSDGYSSYTYQGAKAGTAVTTAIAYTDWDGYEWMAAGTRIPESERHDSVTFQVQRKHIDANLKLRNNSHGNDVAFVNAPSSAEGARVKLFKVRRDGTRKLVASKFANGWGNARFVVRDTRKHAFTKYQALVVRTAKTWADWTPKRRIR